MDALSEVIYFVRHAEKSEDLYHRKNFSGHITASAFVLNGDRTKILLIHHKFLDRWLQPGGHVDASDTNLIEAAKRECVEEVNLNPENLKLLQNITDEGLPFDIDSHHIPANENKKELGHFHHDFRYLFVYEGDENLTIDKTEINNYKWMSLAEFGTQEDFQSVYSKINKLLQKRN